MTSLPDYDFLSAPLWLITILHVTTLTLHLTAMNFLFGGLKVIDDVVKIGILKL